MITALFGFAAGVAFTLAVVWWPSRAHWRQRIDAAGDIRRIEGGFALAAQDRDLNDAVGARQESRNAWIPIYPGRAAQPDPAWLAWIAEGSRPSRSSRRHRGRPEQLETTQPLVDTVQVGMVDLSAFPAWGKPPKDTTLGWGWRERALVPVALALVAAAAVWHMIRVVFPPRHGGRYPWYMKVTDRAWEAGVVFEVSAQQIGRDQLAELDRLLGVLLVGGRAVERSAATVNRWWHRPVDRLLWGLVDVWLVLRTWTYWIRRTLADSRLTEG